MLLPSWKTLRHPLVGIAMDKKYRDVKRLKQLFLVNRPSSKYSLLETIISSLHLRFFTSFPLPSTISPKTRRKPNLSAIDTESVSGAQRAMHSTELSLTLSR
jgi:hypothetical protein